MNPLLMQIWIEAFKTEYRIFRENEGCEAAEAGYRAAQKAEDACRAAQKAANQAREDASKVVKL